ncbi:MAG TPA: amidohydrolase family protein [Candidatus Binatia bacterium]|nr:amidohydrolase family protein [Candidatus Binatia bacterium]
MQSSSRQILVLQHGTLIDGSGGPPIANDALVIDGNRIRSTGPLPSDIRLDRDEVHVIDATGQWIMPGLIDGHCHLSFGFPYLEGVARERGTSNPGFTTLQAARNAQHVLCSGVTSIAVPGGTWFIDVGLRDAITAGVLSGPRIACAGRFIVTYGSILDDEPAWVGTPEHAIGVLANSVPEMITEVRRQCKHGVDFIKLADSTWGETQTIAPEELTAVVQEAHRHQTPVTIHARGAGSTRAAAKAGVDWILHADLATPADLEVVAEAGARLMPTMTFLQQALAVGSEFGLSTRELDLTKRNWDSAVRMLEQARRLGITLLCGTDSGNTPLMPYGELHAHEAEILVRYAGYTPMEAILACTRDNAFVMGLDGEVGVLAAGKLADLIVLTADPLADIRVLQGGQHLAMVIKNGQIVARHRQDKEENLLTFTGATAEMSVEEQR